MSTTLPPRLIRESIGEALRFAVENWRFVSAAAGVGALGATLVAALGAATPLMTLVNTLLMGIIKAFTYAALIGAFFYGVLAVRSRLGRDGMRVWSAMAVVGFFLFILFSVIAIPTMIIIFSGPMAPYLEALEAAGENQDQVMAVMLRFAEENPGVLLSLMLFFGALWFLVTSRLYLAAPATLEQGRILTFETWNWTKGAMLRITAARLLLLVPALILASALAMLLARLLGLGVSPLGGVILGNAPIWAAILYVFGSTFLNFALALALEAGLSSAIYRALKPQTAPPAA